MHPWKICHWTLCRFWSKTTHSHLALITPVSQLYFGESISPFMPRIWSWLLLCTIIWYLLSQILWRNRPEIKNISNSGEISLDARIGQKTWGLSLADVSGNETILLDGTNINIFREGCTKQKPENVWSFAKPPSARSASKMNNWTCF